LGGGDSFIQPPRGDAERCRGALDGGLVGARGSVEIGAGAHVGAHGDLQRLRGGRGGAFGLTKRALEGQRRCGISDDVGRLLDDGGVACSNA
jgi:hypothetical protein